MKQEEAIENANWSLPAGESQPVKKRGRRSKKPVEMTLSAQDYPIYDQAAQKLIANPSGIWPTEFNVLVRPDDVEETTTAPGGTHKFILPIDMQAKEKQASQCGTIVAVSPLAFTYERWPEGAHPPRVGQKAIFAKYAGMRRKGRDGVEYILMKDKDLAATFEG